MPGTTVAFKRVLVGRPRASRELHHTLLPKWMALPVFSSDPMSSVAYATQEMMLVLALAGAGAFSLVRPLSLGVATLLAVVVLSYRQTVQAYPEGGGAYRVSRENLGEIPGLTAASALLIDYVLTVAVSIAAGAEAIISAVPELAAHRVALALAFVAFVTIANLRGVREAGVLFAVPTYMFVATILALVVTGVVRCVGECPQAPSAGSGLEAAETLTLFLILRAFSSGATALTGVEAISNGVPAFRYPQSRNAATTLGIMGALAVTLFLGISYLATATGVVATEESQRTVVAEIALAVFGQGPLFYLVQLVTAAILILAANTAYADFPRLSSILARDRYMPRQLISRGDRLVFSNGVLMLAGAACLLLVAFNASVTSLIQLYVVGVFTSFTLSQTGMVRHHRRIREPNWRRSLAINATGATMTGVVLVVVAITKFAGGAWIVLVGIPTLVMLMLRIHRHYAWVGLQLRAGIAEPEATREHHVVLLLDRVDEAAARALSYARSTVPASLEAIAVPLPDSDVPRRWAELAPDVPVQVVGEAEDRDAAEILRRELHQRSEAAGAGTYTTAVIPETLTRSWWEQLRHHRLALRLKAGLLTESGVVVTDITSPEGGPGPYTVEEPAQHHVVVLVSGVHKATMRALSYAQGLQATSVRALMINLDDDATRRVLSEWDDWSVEVPLELLDSPFRSLTASLREYIDEFSPDGRSTVVTCVLPETLLPHWWQAPLHNQTALTIKSVLLFRRGVVTTSVPYQILDESEAAQEADTVLT